MISVRNLEIRIKICIILIIDAIYQVFAKWHLLLSTLDALSCLVLKTTL